MDLDSLFLDFLPSRKRYSFLIKYTLNLAPFAALFCTETAPHHVLFPRFRLGEPKLEGEGEDNPEASRETAGVPPTGGPIRRGLGRGVHATAKRCLRALPQQRSIRTAQATLDAKGDTRLRNYRAETGERDAE